MRYKVLFIYMERGMAQARKDNKGRAFMNYISENSVY